MRISNPTAQKGEQIACDYLSKKGYRIIDRNFRRGYGEIDIIAVKDSVLVFIEVKTRSTNKFGTPLEQIAFYKIRSLIKTAEFYKTLNPKLPDSLRIDAVSVMLDNLGNTVSIEHIENITS